MHVGTARTALFNWLFARQQNGVFILRIEDTDKERSKKEYEETILKGLEWLALDYQEGPIRQSERGEIYQGYIKKLLDSGSAFYCSHTKEELEKEKEEQMEKKEAPRHICLMRQATNGTQRNAGVIRFKNPGGKVKFTDLVRSEIAFDADLLGDFVIAKDEETPLYNLAAAIDDCDMKISHVIRGEDHISNTPKQILIQQALTLPQPAYAHLPMILGTDKSKLSKRHGATALLDYKGMGYLADAMFNFLALLGWGPAGATPNTQQPTTNNRKDNPEILFREEIVEQFSFEGVQKSGAVFNIEKLDWMNGEYIRAMGLEKLTELCRPYFENYGLRVPPSPHPSHKATEGTAKALEGRSTDYELRDFQKIISLEQPRMKRLAQIVENAEFFFKEKLEYDPELLRWKDIGNQETRETLEKLEKLLSEIPEEDYTKEKLEAHIMPKAEEWSLDFLRLRSGQVARDKGTPERERKIDRGMALWPMRVALTGRKASPGPFEVAEILGKKKCLARVRDAKALLGL